LTRIVSERKAASIYNIEKVRKKSKILRKMAKVRNNFNCKSFQLADWTEIFKKVPEIQKCLVRMNENISFGKRWRLHTVLLAICFLSTTVMYCVLQEWRIFQPEVGQNRKEADQPNPRHTWQRSGTCRLCHVLPGNTKDPRIGGCGHGVQCGATIAELPPSSADAGDGASPQQRSHQSHLAVGSGITEVAVQRGRVEWIAWAHYDSCTQVKKSLFLLIFSSLLTMGDSCVAIEEPVSRGLFALSVFADFLHM
jgi:hypothetical protein